MCFALAESRGLTVAIDDERAVRRAKRRNPGVATISTLAILRSWQERCAISDPRMGGLLQAVFRLARYRPGANHPQFEWWQRCCPWSGT